MGRILRAEESLDPSHAPPKLVRRDGELDLLRKRYREAFAKGTAYHQLLTGGIGSGKTALAHHLGSELEKGGKLGGLAVQRVYVNCWRRSNDRTVLHHLLRAVGVSLPDRGYALAEMLDVFEQGIRKSPRHLLVVLDEVSALVRQETKLVYLLTRSSEVNLGSISLFLVASEDVLPYLDAASRSSFGVTHRLQLRPYDRTDLTEILRYRASLALGAGTYPDEVLDQIAGLASGTGDARFALELLANAARLAEEAGASAIEPEHVRAAKGSGFPTLTESKLEELPEASLLILLALARSLRGPKARVPTERVRTAYASVAEEFGATPVSRVTFWRAVKQLEREGIAQVEPVGSGQSSRLGMDEVPASYLETLVHERASRRAPARKP
ncbi:MAG TPA: AAA family ATPase [Thermoplasmata archaeon]|nr:AAA family ATPase [Thermoplasmata archaeon]